MAKVIVSDRKKTKKVEIECDSTETVLNIKQRFSEEDSPQFLISHQGKLLDNSTPVGLLGNNIELTVENDIEFSDMESGSDIKYQTTSEQDNKMGMNIEAQNISTISSTESGVERRLTEETKQPSPINSTEDGVEKRLAEEIKQPSLVRVKTESGLIDVKKTEIFSLNGKNYLITARKKRFSWNSIKELVKSMVNQRS